MFDSFFAWINYCQNTLTEITSFNFELQGSYVFLMAFENNQKVSRILKDVHSFQMTYTLMIFLVCCLQNKLLANVTISDNFWVTLQMSNLI